MMMIKIKKPLYGFAIFFALTCVASAGVYANDFKQSTAFEIGKVKLVMERTENFRSDAIGATVNQESSSKLFLDMGDVLGGPKDRIWLGVARQRQENQIDTISAAIPQLQLKWGF